MTEHSLFRAAIPAALFACAVAVIAAAWWWMGKPVAMPPSPLAQGEKLYCVSYAPFRGTQSPLTPPIKIAPEQIEDDLARLSKITDCVRTYAIEFGLDRIAGDRQAARLEGHAGHLAVGQCRQKTRSRSTRRSGWPSNIPDVIRALIVGNEVLLRGEMTAQDLAATIRNVKSQANVPVTYADVWEFWLRYRDVYDAVDFVTIHILPYWEDFPISARDSVSHVDAIRRKVAAAFPNKDILIGETGFPSAGRMREGAEPSPSNQARVIHDIIALAKRDNFRVNVIEAFDQPWKRQARRHGRRALGIVRRRQPRVQIRLGRAGLRSSLLAAADRRRRADGRAGVRRRDARAHPPDEIDARRRLALDRRRGHRGRCRHLRSAGGRKTAAAEPRRSRAGCAAARCSRSRSRVRLRSRPPSCAARSVPSFAQRVDA